MFYEVDKGNLGVARGGRLIFTPDGTRHLRYGYGLSHTTNNQAKLLALLQVLHLLKWKGVTQARVLGDSQNLIRLLVRGKPLKERTYRKTIMRIKGLVPTFQEIHFYRILRDLNKYVDQEANRAVSQSQREIKLSDHSYEWDPLP